jgi:hypothetical protein
VSKSKELTLDDLALVSFALRWCADKDSGLDRKGRDRLHRLRLRVDALIRAQTPEHARRRAERERVKERRDARKMPVVSVAEADDWHRTLTRERRDPAYPISELYRRLPPGISSEEAISYLRRAMSRKG